MGQVFNKGLNENERQEGLFKRLTNIEDKTDNQLKAIEGQKNDQLTIIKKSNQPKIGNALREKMKSFEFDIPELNELKEKIIKEIMRTKNLLAHTIQQRKIKKVKR